MKDQLFSREFHRKLQTNVEKGYRDFIEDLREDLQKGFQTDVVDMDFLDQLNDIIHDEVFDKYTPLKFYWLNLVDNLIYVIQLHEELLLDEGVDSDELTELENELFNFWNESEFAESFLNQLKEGGPVIEASNNLLPLQENQIISFYVVHLSHYRQEFGDALMYHTIPELGDFEKRFYITDMHLPVNIKKVPDTFPSLPLLSISPEEGKVTLEMNGKPHELKIEKSAAPITLEEKILFVLPSCDEGIKRQDEFRKNIIKALNNIKKVAPHLYETFKSFTHTIIPVNEPGIVSYSMQSLPGYSSINMFERDSLDLMDDLLHENGHHYLNTYLNHMDLIHEDDDKIYFSPWRKALRPIRGIYHAVFTFHWALEIFLSLNNAVEQSLLTFSKAEKIKIKQRFLEEYFMLEYCRPDLEHAYKNKRITKEGRQLINMVMERVAVNKIEVAPIMNQLKSLDASAHAQIVALKEELTQTRAHYKLV